MLADLVGFDFLGWLNGYILQFFTQILFLCIVFCVFLCLYFYSNIIKLTVSFFFGWLCSLVFEVWFCKLVF